MRSGSCPASCRQSSEPIEPAAPVTSTVFPATSESTRCGSRRTRPPPREERGLPRAQEIDALWLEPHRLARQQVVDLHLAHLRIYDASLDQLSERREHAVTDVGLGAALDDVTEH